MRRLSSSRRNLLTLLAVGVVAVLGTGAPTMAAADSTYKLNIPAQDLGTALKAFGAAVNEQILFSQDVVAGLRSTEVNGEFTPEAAIAVLLEGSGLRVDRTPAGVLLIRRAPAIAPAAVSGVAATKPFRLAEGDTSGADGGSASSESEALGPQQASPNDTQDRRPRLEEIVVTGTHIRGQDKSLSPVIVYDRDAIDRSGYLSTQEFLQSIPQSFAGGPQGASPDGVLGTGNFATVNVEHASAVNLRGLGVNATLTLLNGHRMAPSAHGNIVDTSTIPLAAIDHIDVLTDGASAIYGADAIAGVVNIVLRKDFSGAETEGTYGGGSGRSENGNSDSNLWNAVGNWLDNGLIPIRARYRTAHNRATVHLGYPSTDESHQPFH